MKASQGRGHDADGRLTGPRGADGGKQVLGAVFLRGEVGSGEQCLVHPNYEISHEWREGGATLGGPAYSIQGKKDATTRTVADFTVCSVSFFYN